MTCLKGLDMSDKFMHCKFLVHLKKVQYPRMLMVHLKLSVINMYLPLVYGMQTFNGIQMLLL